jgi:hypothetical protein
VNAARYYHREDGQRIAKGMATAFLIIGAVVSLVRGIGRRIVTGVVSDVGQSKFGTTGCRTYFHDSFKVRKGTAINTFLKRNHS